MIALTRLPRPLPRAAAIVGLMVAVVVATQLVALLRPAPPSSAQLHPAEAVPGLAQLAPADLDTGTGTATADAEEVARIKGDVAFWSARFAKNHLDFVSATQWGANEIALGRETGDISAYVRAEAAFDAALATFADNPAAIDGKAGVLVTLHRFTEARDLAASEIAHLPGDQTALATLGDANLELGDVAGARAAYAKALALGSSAAILARESHLAFITGDTSTAIAQAHAAVAASDVEGAEGERAAFYRYQLGDTLLSSGDAAGAKAAFTSALDQDERSFLALSGLARIAVRDADPARAIELLSRAIAIVPQPDLLARRADLYLMRDGPGDAKDAAKDMATVEAIAKLAGDAGNVYDRTLSLYLANHGLDPARALQLADSELVTRRDVYGYDADAWALLENGRPRDAATMMARALEFGTRDAKLLYHDGMIAVALGDSERARRQLTAALDLDPSFDPLQADRARQAIATLK